MVAVRTHSEPVTMRPDVDQGRRSRLRGTTLVEVLVVMVVFLVGILAVVQIFPKGFQILLLSRNASVATALARDEVQRLKARPDELPEAIVATTMTGAIDPNQDPDSLGPNGQDLEQDGSLMVNSTRVGNWNRYAGANRFRHVVGEGHRLSAPRQIGQFNAANYGSLVIAKFNPVDTTGGRDMHAYGADLTVNQGAWDPQTDRGEMDAFLTGSDGSALLQVPSGAAGRRYRVSFTGYVGNGSGFTRQEFTGLYITVSGNPVRPSTAIPYPLAQFSFQSLANLEGFPVLAAIDPTSVRVQREFVGIAPTANWSTEDAYQVKLMSGPLGTLLFHPSAYTLRADSGPAAKNVLVRVDYDVYDWRVLREEFSFPYNLPAEHKLALGSLLTTSTSGPDGLYDQGIDILEGENAPTLISNTNNYRADHFVLQDLITGGVFIEQAPGAPSTTNSPVFRIDKSAGIVSVLDTDNDSSNGTTVPLLLLDGTVTTVQLDGRAVRAMYMVKNSFAVQVLKSPSLYSVTYELPGAAHYYVGGTGSIGGGSTRVYFPRSDAGRKITVGELNYRRTGDVLPRQLFGQDFVIRRSNAADPVGLPYIDIRDADPLAQQVDVAIDARSRGYGLRDVKCASLSVRTIWNPDSFSLGQDSQANMERLNHWVGGYRKSTIETYLEQGSLAQ